MKKSIIFIAAALLAFLAGCGKEKSTLETTAEEKQDSRTVVRAETGKSPSELSIESKKKLDKGVQEVFYSGKGGEALGENRAALKRGREENWKYYTFEKDVLREQDRAQDNTYTKTISKKDLFENGQGDSFDLECELTLSKENDEILSYSSEDNWETASIQAVYNDHTLWLQGKAIVPDSLALKSETYVLYDFETDKVEAVFESGISEEDESVPRGACFSPDGKKALFRSSGYELRDLTVLGQIVYINKETGEKRVLSEIMDVWDRDFAEVSFLDDTHVFAAQTRNAGNGTLLEQGFIWDTKTNEVRKVYGEEEILVFNSEKSMRTQGLGIFIIGETAERYRIANLNKEFFIESPELLSKYEVFPGKDKAVLLKTEENAEEEDIIKELGVLDLERERLIFLENAAVLGKEYDNRHLAADSDGSVGTGLYDSVRWNDENSFAVNGKDGFYLYRMIN